MNQLKMKAKAGVTLVELLVVILIVTILSVSMLPLLQPFVTEAQYAAEAIPVIGNLRTKIGLYQYDKGKLPYGMLEKHGSTSVETWEVDSSDPEKWVPAYYNIGNTPVTRTRCTATGANADAAYHFGYSSMLDINYEDLKGKRSKPIHYQYCALSPTNNMSYVIACFGDGNGLKAGTGYAVCELNFTGIQKKYIGTWKRYKPVKDSSGAIVFTNNNVADVDGTKYSNCFIPTPAQIQSVVTPAASSSSGTTQVGEPNVVTWMKNAGWEF